MPQFLSGKITSQIVSVTQWVTQCNCQKIACALILTVNPLTSCFLCVVLGLPVDCRLGLCRCRPKRSINAPNTLMCLSMGERTSNIDPMGHPQSEI